MSNERAFKGVWIPKEVWLSKELSLIEKVLLVEISSLDNDKHCTASNVYFAEFCNCGIATITRAIAHLKELSLIEELPYDGRVRKLRLIKMSSPTNQNDYSDQSKRLPINIDNKLDNNINTITNVIAEPPTAVPSDSSKKITPLVDTDSDTSNIPSNDSANKSKKKNLYEKCMDVIDDFTDNNEVKNLLHTYLLVRLERKDKPFGANTFKSTLNKLKTLSEGKTIQEQLQIIQYSIDGQYGTFYPLSNRKSYKTHDKFGEFGVVKSIKATKEEIRDEVF